MKSEPQNCTELEHLSLRNGFLCEVCHKHEAVYLCGFCGKRVCPKCMGQKPRACCGQEPKGTWE